MRELFVRDFHRNHAGVGVSHASLEVARGKEAIVKRTKDLKMNPPSLAGQAQQHTVEAIAELVNIVQNTNSHAARLAAITTLLDRGFGKPPKPLDIAIKDRVKPGPPPSEEELERRAAAYYRFRKTGHFSIDDLDDADLEAYRASITRTPKAEGKS
jgi:hypothetical protein